jgi:catechol 2,3-dioxygenase-like lactoylglutathione lyase family enzyme
MSRLENLKKQAKQVVRWHREGRHPVAAMIRGGLPGYAGLTDAQIMAGPFRLADAQRLIARREGYETWAALAAQGDATMATEKPVTYPQQPVLLTAEPNIFVTDFSRAQAYYVEALGFRAAFTYGEPPFYGQMVRDGAMICLRQVRAPVLDHRVGGDLLSANVVVSNARLLFLEMGARGAIIHQALKREPWHGQGQGNFIVADPDGNLIQFGGRTD